MTFNSLKVGAGAFLALAVSTAALAQSTPQTSQSTSQPGPVKGTTVTQTVAPSGDNGARTSTTLSVPTSQNTSVGGYVANTYTQPSQGGSGPQQGTQRGSTTTTSAGVSAQVTFP